ncbi:unnamed protein product [Acanthoscelides obtectus]|uniref:DDE Tnp4 domain-containing protein n=1 Tax=Acanthoscelides obtectus TaxID=200917 RepID=A0A9P0KW43_ACAOB|nr:unnamed protein product [Acanthoscelides obtectus]CAK1655180.1 Protein ALP1-like [Acanthoscelides obtectus]
MEHIYLPEPTENIWKKCAEEFENRWGFPNCIGSVDGKHVTVKRPNNSGSNYWCYLHKYSIVLMAIVGPDYKFICVDIGGFGKNSDGGIFETSNMGKRFEQNLSSVPAPRFLPGQNEICSYVLIDDEAFALKPYLKRPFPYKLTLTDVRKEKYNDPYQFCPSVPVVPPPHEIIFSSSGIPQPELQCKKCDLRLTEDGKAVVVECFQCYDIPAPSREAITGSE